MCTPGIDIAMKIDGMARGPRLRIEIRDLGPWWILMVVSGFIEKCDPGDLGSPACVSLVCACAQGGQQLFHGGFAFAEDHEFRARLEILLRVGSRFRTTDDDTPAGLARDLHDLDRV